MLGRDYRRKAGVKYTDRFAVFIDCKCLRTDDVQKGFQPTEVGITRIAHVMEQTKSVRICIELNYMKTVSLFAFMGMELKFKVFESCGVARIYIVATLFKNSLPASMGTKP